MAENIKTETTGFKLPDPAVIGRSMADIAERSQRIVNEWLKRQADEEHAPDPLNIGSAFLEMTARLIANPARLMTAGLGFWHFRRKLGEYRKAPTMSDRLQAVGTWNQAANRGSVTWSTIFDGKPYMTASHRQSGGVPSGGNFLFEDGHAEWRVFKIDNPRGTVDLGSQSPGWALFYRPSNIDTNR